MATEKKARIVIVGAGGHAKVCIEVIRAQGIYEVFACVGHNAGISNVLGVPLIGGDEVLVDLFSEGVRHAFVAIGDNQVREVVAYKLKSFGFDLPSAVHASSFVSSSASVGQGVLIMPRVVVNAEARVDELAILNTGSIVEHDCVVGKAAHIGPGSVLTGNVSVGARAFLGAGTVVRPNTRVSDGVTAGAGAVIVSNIEPCLTVVGVPARPVCYEPRK